MSDIPEASTSAAVDTSAAEPLSKKAQKRLAKQEKYAEFKVERRERERAAKKRKKAERREAIEIGEDVQPLQKKRRPAHDAIKAWDGTCILELAFDDKMTDKELISLQKQLAHCYSSMRYSTQPMPLLCTSFGGKLADRMNGLLKGVHERWTGTKFTESSLQALMDSREVNPETVVYLTADSPNELEELEPGKSYVIGALVDKNRYKNLCYNRAKEMNIAHARLPIGQYIQNMPTRKVLTVNQCYDILLQWVETKDWETAFYSVIPKRKFEQPRNGQAGSSKGEQEEQEEDEDEDEELLTGLEEPEHESVTPASHSGVILQGANGEPILTLPEDVDSLASSIAAAKEAEKKPVPAKSHGFLMTGSDGIPLMMSRRDAKSIQAAQTAQEVPMLAQSGGVVLQGANGEPMFMMQSDSAGTKATDSTPQVVSGCAAMLDEDGKPVFASTHT